ncbi:AAA family ATPase [Candidatus Pacearchaeota archaeon]|nr:AAA family ATPase [Candidatus Pacearchaeota archaeon]
MARAIVITSGKGGVGKTTSAINLGAALNKFGEDVLVIDANVTTPNVGINLGAPNVPVSLHHVLSGKAKTHEAVYEHDSGMKVMPGSISPQHMKNMKYEKFDELVKQAKRLADFIIVDCAAGLGREANMAISAADEILIITQPEIAALTDALKAIKLAESMDKKVLGAVLTRVRNKKYELKKENVEEMLDIPVISIIPEDDSVQEALRIKDAVLHTHPRSKAAKGYKELASYLTGERIKEKENWVISLLKNIGFIKKTEGF